MGDETENVHKDHSSEDDSFPQTYCTYAVTGPKEQFQAIYICKSCCNDDDSLTNKHVCLCQACADACHEGHDALEYVGMGPSYCDCHCFDCKIESVSQQEAKRLGVGPNSNSSVTHIRTVASDHDDDDSRAEYIRNVFTIRSLENGRFCTRLQRQAQELIQHSRETFWLDTNMDASTLCDLERLALAILRQHSKYYLKDSNQVCGAEWWVQVKPVSVPPPTHASRLQPYNNGSEAVDLHYDKDEALAESFGLGSFPTLSTVTYLTHSSAAPPTLVLDHCYDESDDKYMSEMLVSRPRRGKHLVFDGRLLHGAPSHYALRPLIDDELTTIPQDPWRITFLVNLWMDHRPAGVHVLSSEIRNAFGRAVGDDDCSNGSTMMIPPDVQFDPCDMDQVDLACVEKDLSASLRGRIQLPFVGKGTTWGGDGDFEEDATVLVTFPPPPSHVDDTVLVRFGSGLEAYLLHNADGQEDSDNDRDGKNADTVLDPG